VYNGEPYLKSALRSIQNQDFKSIEIIMIDDNSKDNSVKLIKELMKEDSRIVFLKNLENKGALYTKTQGALNARGKYILTLDVDDLYTSKNAFSILYSIAEKDKLDLLGFSIIISNRNITNKHLVIHHYWETEVLYQPNVSYMMYAFDEKKNPKRIGDVISCYFMKRKVLVQSIKEIGEEFLHKKIIHHDDFFVFFMLSRKSLNLKQIKKPFYIVLIKFLFLNYISRN
jgi:glycosyltransferase involved in cell wall biosynthesis